MRVFSVVLHKVKVIAEEGGEETGVLPTGMVASLKYAPRLSMTERAVRSRPRLLALPAMDSHRLRSAPRDLFSERKRTR